MKWWIIVLAILAVAGCSKPVEKEYTQEKFANVTRPVVHFEKCMFGELAYYTDGLLIFQSDSEGNLRVLSPIGDYSKPSGYPRWQLRSYMDRNDSIFNQTWDMIIEGKEPNGNPVTCAPENSIPSVFVEFLESHSKLFRDFERVR